MQAYFESHPGYEQEIEESFIQFKNNRSLSRSNVVLTIPIHFIIVHPPGQSVGSSDNISMERIQSQIDVLNEDYRKLNIEAETVPSAFSSADVMIEFCLANKDPEGKVSLGVTRYATDDDFDTHELQIKAATGWDRKRYLNIWVSGTVNDLGYAYIPTLTSLPDNVLDGVVIRTDVFGDENFSNHPYADRGRTATHEIGHYLGLKHLWGNGASNSNCNWDDGMDDTPKQIGYNVECPLHPSPSCNNDGDMFMNFMDYTDDYCMAAFTFDQSEYMRTILNNIRSGLLNSADINCAGPPAPPLVLELKAKRNLECGNVATGMIEVEVISGTPPYLYSFNGGLFDFDFRFEDLDAGIHMIIVQDESLQFDTLEVNIEQPNPILVELIEGETNACVDDANASFLIAATGGSDPLTVRVNGENMAFVQPMVIDQLSKGTYNVLVTDANECSVESSITIEDGLDLDLQIMQIVNNGCGFDENKASLQVSASGGHGSYNYTLDGTTNASGVFTKLYAGEYNLLVEDLEGCQAEMLVDIPVNEEIRAEISQKTASICSQATGSVLFDIPANSDYILKVDNVAQLDPLFEGLSKGAHFYSIEDDYCSLTGNFTIDHYFGYDIAIQDLMPISCLGQKDGSVSLVPDGTDNFIFSIDGSSNSDGIFEALEAKTYTVTVSIGTDCDTTISFTIPDSEAIILQLGELTNNLCTDSKDGIVQLITDGGIGEVTYELQGIAENQTGLFTELASGDYIAFVEDENNCQDSIHFKITDEKDFEIEISELKQISCHGDANGIITIAATPALANEYTFILDGDASISNTSGNFSNLEIGPHTVEVINSANCKKSINFVIVQPQAIVIDLSSTEQTGAQLGTISIVASSGNAPYQYALDNINFQSQPFFDDLEAGDYTVYVKDATDCVQFKDIKIDLNTSINDGDSINGLEYFISNSLLTVTVNNPGIYEALIYNISGQLIRNFRIKANQKTSTEISDLNPGIYILQVMDAQGKQEVNKFLLH